MEVSYFDEKSGNKRQQTGTNGNKQGKRQGRNPLKNQRKILQALKLQDSRFGSA